MDELKKQWAERARAASDNEQSAPGDYNFWAVMASEAPLSNTQAETFRYFILSDLSAASGKLIEMLEEGGHWQPGLEKQIKQIKEALSKCEALSAMFNYHSKYETI